MSIKIEPGAVYGSLEVLRRAGTTPGGAALWRCRCRKCGAECDVEGRRLRAGTQTDCGCTSRARRIAPGKVFGGLEILRPSGEKYRTMKKWIVRCAVCGQEREMLSSSILRDPKSCGCLPPNPETARASGAQAVPVSVQDGVQVFVATKTTPNRGNQTGFRWVRVIHRPTGDWIYAKFQIKGETYYQGGFSSRETAHAWAEKNHAEALRKLGITDPRQSKEAKQKKEET